jgi:hypothetical protein
MIEAVERSLASGRPEQIEPPDPERSEGATW